MGKPVLVPEAIWRKDFAENAMNEKELSKGTKGKVPSGFLIEMFLIPLSFTLEYSPGS